jgi:hypothetical protein
MGERIMAEAPWEKFRTEAEKAQAGPWEQFSVPSMSAERAAMSQELASSVGPMEAFRIAMGRGFTSLGRGTGLVKPEEPVVTEAFGALQQQRPGTVMAGEIIGEAAPFVVPGVGISSIAGLAPRVLASGALGALEGGLITRGRGGTTGDTIVNTGMGATVAGGLEAVYPKLSRLGGAVVRRITGSAPKGPLFTAAGTPTPELQAALTKMGMTIDELESSAESILRNQPEGADAEQALRAARFEQTGIPATQGNITQDFAQQAQEERLSSMASAQAGEPLRQLQLQQSEAFQQGIGDLVNSLGVTGETGDLVKRALTGRLEDLKGQKNKLYKSFAEQSTNAAQMPLFTQPILDAMPPKAELRRISRLNGNNVAALDDLLVEFGVDQSQEGVERFVKSGGEITPLNIQNFEDFRQALNQLVDTQTPGGRATSAIVGKLKGVLDDEASIVEQALMDANILDSNLIEPLREARSIVARMKTEFSAESIAGRLINSKRDGVTPIIEASKVYDAVVGRNQPIEYLERTMEQLRNSGAKGRQASAALQVETIMRAMENALKAPSRKTSGIQTLGFSQFSKALDQVGDERLALIFADNPRALAGLRQYKGVAEDLTVDARATPRGSAPVILDVINRMGRAPGIAAFVDTIKFVVNAGADERAVRRAMNARPQIRRSIQQIQNDFPALASALGIAGIVTQEEQQ